jgi:hypothetical protein
MKLLFGLVFLVGSYASADCRTLPNELTFRTASVVISQLAGDFKVEFAFPNLKREDCDPSTEEFVFQSLQTPIQVTVTNILTGQIVQKDTIWSITATIEPERRGISLGESDKLKLTFDISQELNDTTKAWDNSSTFYMSESEQATSSLKLVLY